MKRILISISMIGIIIFIVSCTEESRNKMFRSADNVLGKDLKVSYVSEGKIIKTWTVRDGKVTTGKDEKGTVQGYYFFWSEETGYVQVPIERTLIEEIRD